MCAEGGSAKTISGNPVKAKRKGSSFLGLFTHGGKVHFSAKSSSLKRSLSDPAEGAETPVAKDVCPDASLEDFRFSECRRPCQCAEEFFESESAIPLSLASLAGKPSGRALLVMGTQNGTRVLRSFGSAFEVVGDFKTSSEE